VTVRLPPHAPNPQPPVGYSPCDVREIDLIIRTGDVGSYRQLQALSNRKWTAAGENRRMPAVLTP
jgi:hypothetical protein